MEAWEANAGERQDDKTVKSTAQAGREDGKSMKHFWKYAVVAGAASLLLITGLGACSKPEEDTSSLLSSAAEDASLFPAGTTMGGRNIGGKTLDEALDISKKALEEAVDSLEISVKFKDDTILLQKGDFVIQDVLEKELPKLLENRSPQEYALPYVADLSPSGRQKLEDAAKTCYVEAKDATVESYNGEKFSFTQEQAGVRVDMAATLKSVRQLLSQKHDGDIQAAFLETKPKLTQSYLNENFKLLSTYSTTSTNTENGNSNMRLALSHINGTVLEPEQEFSYNTALGDSTDPSRGWLPAGGINGGVLVQMYGGGICQGSTTLYNAALLAGMEITARECHSMPSSYCPIGLDATVDYGNIDFKFKNPLDAPVYIAAWMDNVDLHVSFFGVFPKEWDKISVSSEQTGSSGPLSEVSFVVDAGLAKGAYKRKTSGNNGYSAKAYRTFLKGDATVRTEELPSSYYPPTGKVFIIGEGTDTSKIDTGKEEGNTLPSPSPSPKPSVSPSPTPTIKPSEPTPPPVTPPPVTPPPVTPPPVTPDPVPSFNPEPPVSQPPEGGSGEGSGVPQGFLD